MIVSMNCVCTAVNIRTNITERARGASGMSTSNVYMSMAEDIKDNCEFSECISYEEDDFGKLWLDYVCPFYDANDERCRIGDPSTWEL